MSDLEFIHRFAPPASDSSGRTLLLLHGTGGDENDLIDIGRVLDSSAGLLSPRGKVLENGMPRFFRRLAEGIFDEEDLVRRTHQLADFLRAAAIHYKLDPKRMFAVGYSNGANIAAAILLLRPELFAGAILFRAMVPLVPESLPNLKEVPVFISAGNVDPIVPVANVKRLGAMLREAGANVSLHYVDAGHALAPNDIEDAREWLAKVVISV